MKDFRSVLSDYLNKHDRHRKQLAAVVSLSMLVSFSVPMILTEPAVSMTQDSFSPVGDILSAQLFNASNANMISNFNNGEDANDGYSKGQLSEVTLLIGNGSDLAEGANSVADVIANARKKYFLGIASDFCVFLENDFIPTESDAEGRVAVGGDIIFANGWNYQIGNGDFTSSTALKNTDNYIGITDYAHAIVGGKISHVNTLSMNKDNNPYPKDEDLYKRLVVGNKDDSNHYIWGDDGRKEVPYVTSGHNHDNISPNELAQMYDSNSLINFTDAFSYIRGQSKNLSKVKQTTGATVSWSGSTLTCNAPEGCTDEIIYFTLEEWNDPLEINFNNIPENANIVVNYNGTECVKIFGNEYFNIETTINGTSISKQGTELNNNKKSENILYNFYNVSEVQLCACINGTILAPNADVASFDTDIYAIDDVKNILLNGSQSEKDDILGKINARRGHLSGSLIAKSFVGGEEFGYRPYRGPSNIVPSSSGYGVPIKKVIANNEKTPLAGATFEITDGNEYSNTFTSDANGDGYVNIPSQVDFSGETTYDSTNNVIEKIYTICEKNAPTGFVKDDTTTYEITVTETIDINSMHENADGTKIPSKVLTEVTSNGESFTIGLEDIYDESSGERTKRELTIGDEIYVIDIDKGDATNVYKRAKDSKATSITTLSSSGTLFTTVIETSGMSTMTEENGDVKTTNLVTEKVEKDFDYNISAVACTPNSANVDAELILYYKDDTKETIDISTNAFNWNTSEDGSFNEYWGQNNIEKKDVIGFDVNIKSIEKDFELYIKGSSDNGDFDWSNDIFSRTFNKDEFDNENGFTYSFGRQELPTDESERYEDKVVSYDVVTTDAIFSTEVNTYLTETWTKAIGIYDTETIAAFNENGYKSPTTFTTVVGSKDYNYKYDPETLMIMPQPLNTPTFENDYGLVFEKVDDEGKPVSGATIEIQEYEFIDMFSGNWKTIEGRSDILGNGSSTTINLDGLKEPESWEFNGFSGTTFTVYRFVETYTPDYYETANPIYFVRDFNNIIHYKPSETDITFINFGEDWASWKTVDLTKNNNPAERKTIEMVDIKIRGAEIKLEKYDSDFENKLDGATFKLYASNDELIYPLNGTTFTIEADTPFNLYEELRKANKTAYNTDYVQNGYLKPGSYYLEEIDAPEGYDGQGKFGFRVKNDYSIVPVDAGTPMSDPEDMYLGTADGNPTLTITGTLLEIAKANPDEIFVDNLWKVNQVHVSSDGSDWGGNLNITNKSSYTFNEILKAANKSTDEIKYVRFMQWEEKSTTYSDATSQYYDGSPASSGGSGSSLDNGTGLTMGMNGNNGTVTVSGALLAKAKENPDIEFIELDKSGAGQIHILTNSITNIDYGQIADTVNKTKYSLNDILSLAQKENKASSINDITTVRFIEWTNGDTLTGKALLEVDETPTEPDPDPTESEETEDLAVQVDGDTIKIPNKKSGDKITITVEKKWVNDDGFEDLRPASIEVQLKRKKSDGLEDDEFNSDETYKATLDNDNDWKNSWSGLDRLETSGDEDSSYIYYVEEIGAIENYTVSYDNNNDDEQDTLTSGGTLKITNTLNTINIDIKKTWDTNNCDDAVIPNDIEVKVQFKKADDDDSKWADVKRTVETTDEDGETVSSLETLTFKLTKNDNWKGAVENLPDIYEYRFVEIDVPTGWESDNSDTAKKGDLSASITNTFMTGELGIEKNWANDSATDRPETLTISLYRTTKAPEPDTSETDEDTQVNQLNENYEDITVTEGETIVLSTGDEGILILNSEKTVEWNDTENDKVKVEDGILTVLDEGITTISATIDDTPTIFNVNVKIASVIPEVSGMQKVKDIETFGKSDNTWTANVDNLPLYSPDGKPYYYYIVEKYTGADGKTVTGNNCTYYSVSYSDAVTLIGNPSTTPTLSVTNEKVDTEGITLPEAGGSGTHNYYIAGICIIGMAGMFWFIRRRRTAK